jgi:hypothetical protein
LLKEDGMANEKIPGWLEKTQQPLCSGFTIKLGPKAKKEIQ